ncbi:MAG: outer membrane protein assembly factor BamB family protein [Planctomycetota bacterium]
MEDEVFHFPFSPKVLEVLQQGQLDVAEIMDASSAGKFEVSKILAILLEQHALEPVSLADLEGMANEAAQSGDNEQAAKFFRRIVDLGGATPTVNMQLGYALEALQEREQAARFFKEAAQSYVTSGQANHAYDSYARVARALPSDLPAVHKMVEIACDHDEVMEANRNEIISMSRVLADCYQALGSLPTALKLLHRLAKANSSNMPLRNALVSLYMDGGMNEEAMVELEAMADLSSKEKRFDEAVRYLRKVATIDRSRKGVKKKIEALTSERDKTRRIVLKIVGFVVVIAVAGTAFWGWKRVTTQRAADIKKINELVDSELDPGLQAFEKSLAEFEAAITELETWADLKTDRIQELATVLQTSGDAMEKSVSGNQERVNQLFEEHSALLSENFRDTRMRSTRRKLDKGISERDRLYRKISEDGQRLLDKGRRTAERDGRPFSATENIQRATTLLSLTSKDEDQIAEATSYLERLQSYRTKIDEEQAKAEALRDEGRLRDARDALCTFLGTYQSKEFNEVVRLYLKVTTVPEGAYVRILRGNGVGEEPKQAPLVLEYTVADGLKMEVTAEGFKPREIDILPVGDRFSPESLMAEFPFETTVPLDKVPVWTAEVGQGGVDAAPVTSSDGKFMVVAARNGRLYHIQSTTGEVRSYDIRSPSGFQASPVVVGETVYSASLDGRIAALRLSDLSEIWWKDESLGLGTVYGSPIVVDGNLVVAGSGGTVRAYDVKNGSMAWEVKLDSGVRLPLLFLRGRIIAPCDDGRLRAINRDGSFVVDINTARGGDSPVPPAGPAIAADNKVLVHHQGRAVQVSVIELPQEGSTKKEHVGYRISFPAPTANTSGIAYRSLAGGGGELYQLLQDGTLRVVDMLRRATVGKVTRVIPAVDGGAQPAPLGAPAVSGDQCFVAAEDALRAFVRGRDGEFHPAWSWIAPAGDALSTGPVIVGRLVVVCTRKGRVHALRRD